MRPGTIHRTRNVQLDVVVRFQHRPRLSLRAVECLLFQHTPASSAVTAVASTRAEWATLIVFQLVPRHGGRHHGKARRGAW